MSQSVWGFYGRREELSHLAKILGRGRWFFARLSGRRRIGKISLVQQALQPAQRARERNVSVGVIQAPQRSAISRFSAT